MLFDLWRQSVASVCRHRKHVAGRTAVFLVRTSMLFQCPADISLHPPGKIPRLRFPTRTATSVSPEHSRLFASFCLEEEGHTKPRSMRSNSSWLKWYSIMAIYHGRDWFSHKRQNAGCLCDVFRGPFRVLKKMQADNITTSMVPRYV